MVRCAWAAASTEMCAMFNACLVEGVFPDAWKVGRLIVLPKGGDKPLTDPKAYRPITLLSVLGKILERLFLIVAPSIGCNLSPAQHGFRRGKSTTTALSHILERSSKSLEKYVQLIFLDIAGAFDNAWWPMILLKAKQGGLPSNLYRMLVSYFSDRRVGMVVGDRVEWKVSTMGCPQGSVLGPALWNLLLDDLLKLPFRRGVDVVAYADDVTVLIEAPSRAAIERESALALDAILAWGKRNRLAFSGPKSRTMTVKGSLARPPTIKLGQLSVAPVAAVRVLGVYLDNKLSFAKHAADIGERGVKCFAKVSRVSASTWGIRYKGLRIIYAGTYVATLTYAAAVWFHAVSRFVVKKSLLKTQRQALILLTKAYRSVSTAALPVLSGVLPADLEVLQAGRRAVECAPLEPGRERRAHIAAIAQGIVECWQGRWDESPDGSDLRAFFPTVQERLRCVWVEPDYVTSQLLTGHGHFRARLHRMALCDTASCHCGHPAETRDHSLWECSLYDDARRTLRGAIIGNAQGPVGYAELVGTREGYSAFVAYARTWHERRKMME